MLLKVKDNFPHIMTMVIKVQQSLDKKFHSMAEFILWCLNSSEMHHAVQVVPMFSQWINEHIRYTTPYRYIQQAQEIWTAEHKFRKLRS